MSYLYEKIKKGIVDSLKISEKIFSPPYIEYKGEQGELLGFVFQFDEGMDLMILRGKLNRPLKVSSSKVHFKNNMVFSYGLNVHEISLTDHLGQELSLIDSDVYAIHNLHSGYHFEINKQEGFFFLSVSISGKTLEEYERLLKENLPNLIGEDNHILFLGGHLSHEVRKVFLDFFKRFGIPLPYFANIAKAKMIEIMNLSIYELSLSKSSLHKYYISREKLQLANKLRTIILDDLSKHLSISELSAQVGASETLIKNTFQKVYGIPLYTYYQEKRLEKSIELINENALSISDIAYELGFSTPSNFSKFFKIQTGMTPKEYKKKAKAT